ncbi:MAG: ABC transporter permease [Oscillospiraceae bacterium]|nr:ABC transporter permease [Oscillospiraceae bacterium]
MNGLLASIQKDIRLLIGSGGRAVAMLLLPILLSAVMFFGMADLANQRAAVPSFPIAIRDLDDTIMSRMLIDQIEDIELFDTVYHAGDEPDEQLIATLGVAAVLTLPQDFFFSLYDMRNYTVEITLNANMPLETTIFRAILSSVMDIISENQQMMWAVHTLQYGELDDAARQELYWQASLLIVADALGRQGVFAPEQTLLDDATDTALFLYGAILSLFLLFIPLCILKTLPEEMRIGILPRYLAKGGSLPQFILSKGLTAFLICFFVWALLTALIFPFSFGPAFLLFLLCFLASFAFFLLISTLVQDPARSQLVGNLILLLFLVLGGGLYPIQMLPTALQTLSRFTIPYYLITGLSGIGLGFSTGGIFALIWPLLAAAFVCTLLALLLLRNGRYIRR